MASNLIESDGLQPNGLGSVGQTWRVPKTLCINVFFCHLAFAQKSSERSVTASLRMDFCTKSTLQPVLAICLTIFALTKNVIFCKNKELVIAREGILLGYTIQFFTEILYIGCHDWRRNSIFFLV